MGRRELQPPRPDCQAGQRQQFSQGRNGRTRTWQEASPSARDSDKGEPQRAEPFREGSMLGGQSGTHSGVRGAARGGEDKVSSQTLGLTPSRQSPGRRLLPFRGPAGVSRDAGVAPAKRERCPPTDTSPGAGVTSFIARRQGSRGRRGWGGWAGPAQAEAQLLGHRSVKEPRLQRKSGSGCSGRSSTDTRRWAPRWLRGMQSDTRTSRGRPSLQRTGRGDKWAGGRQAGWQPRGPGPPSPLPTSPPSSPLAVSGQHAHQLPHAVVQRRPRAVQTHHQVVLTLQVQHHQLVPPAGHAQPCHLGGQREQVLLLTPQDPASGAPPAAPPCGSPGPLPASWLLSECLPNWWAEGLAFQLLVSPFLLSSHPPPWSA